MGEDTVKVLVSDGLEFVVVVSGGSIAPSLPTFPHLAAQFLLTFLLFKPVFHLNQDLFLA